MEKILAPIINRILGDYIEDLDSGKLNIAFLQGTVRLDQVGIKETALDSLDLPVKLRFGFVDRINLKIPWHAPYTEPTIVEVEGVYLVIVPNQGIAYNEEKAKKLAEEAKQSALKRLEEMREAKRKTKQDADDTFTEKLISQVIKNLQVTIKMVHICYEDRFSNRKRQFSAGITIQQLVLETTDAEFNPTIHKKDATLFYKLVSLQNLAIYFNEAQSLLSDLNTKEEIIPRLLETIAVDDKFPQHFHYILRPLSVKAKLVLNQRPEKPPKPFSTPKIDLELGLEGLILSLLQHQYQDILLFLEAQERFNLSGKYLKYRPKGIRTYHGNYKIWWNYAKDCVLDEVKIRQTNKENMAWEKIKAHRELVKSYTNAWVQKRTQKGSNHQVDAIIKDAESRLNLFNLNVARQLAESRIDHERLIRVEDQQQQSWGSWVGSWFSPRKGTEQDKKQSEAESVSSEEGGLVSQLMSDPGEKEKLYAAIGYQENMPPTDYPLYYEQNIFTLNIQALKLILDNFVHVNLGNMEATMRQRPASKGMSFCAAIKSVSVSGCDRPVVEMLQTNRKWMDFALEVNPVDESCDQSVKLTVAPVLVKYSAEAVNRIVDVFMPPESVRLHQILSLAFARYEEIKERSVTGLKYFVDQAKLRLDIDICIESSPIAICHGGEFNADNPTLMVELGEFRLHTRENIPDEVFAHIADIRQRETLEEAYNNFEMILSGVKATLASDFHECFSARENNFSPLHLLKPTTMRINALKSLVDDIQLTNLRILGNLPNIVLELSADRIVDVLKLVNSIPLPKFEEPAEAIPVAQIRQRAKMRAIMEVNEIDEEAAVRLPGAIVPTKSEMQHETASEQERRQRQNQVQIDVRIKLDKINLLLFKKTEIFIDASINSMKIELEQRMFDMKVNAVLGSLIVMTRSKKLIDNIMQKEGDPLIHLKYTQADPQSDYFTTEYHENDQSLDINFQTLNFNLYKDSLTELKLFTDNLLRQLAKIKPAETPQIAAVPNNARQPRHRRSSPRKTSRAIRRRSSSRASRVSSQGSVSQMGVSTPMVEGRAFPFPEEKRKKRFRFHFRMNEIAAVLYAKMSEIKGGVFVQQNDKDDAAFGALNIKTLLVGGSMLDDGQIEAAISLNDFTMEDRRPGSRVSKLMDKRPTLSGAPPIQLVSMKYTQDSEQNKNIVINSSRFYLLLAPEFLGVLAALLSFASAQESDELEDQAAVAVPNLGIKALSGGQIPGVGNELLDESYGSSRTEMPEPVVNGVKIGAITLHCNLSELEVILLEDSLHPSDSQALVLSFNAFVEGNTKDDEFTLTGALNDLQVASTYFMEDKRHLTNFPVLQKFKIGMNGVVNQATNAQNFIIAPEDVNISLSPAVVRLLSAVSAQFSEHQIKDETQTGNGQTKLKRFTDYWVQKKFDKDQFWWFENAAAARQYNAARLPEQNPNEGDDVIVAEPTEVPDITPNKQKLSVKDFAFSVEIFTDDSVKPMILLESTLGADANNWSTELSASAFMTMRASYYNEELRTFEPLIEQVPQSPTNWKNWQINLKATSNTDVKKPKMEISIESNERLNLTVTKTFIDLSSKLSEAFQRAAKQIAPPMGHQILPGTSPYIICNLTGLDIQLSGSNLLAIEKSGINCPNKEYVGLDFVVKKHRRQRSSIDERQIVELTFKFPSMDTERIIDVSYVKKMCIPLPRTADSGLQWTLLAEVTSEKLRFLITLRSLVTFVNHLTLPVELYVDSVAKPGEKDCCGRVNPDESYNLPLNYLYSPIDRFYFKPIMNDAAYNISNESVSWHTFTMQRRSYARCDLVEDATKAFYFEIVVEDESIVRANVGAMAGTAWNVHIYPPLHLINLLPLALKITNPVEKELMAGEGTELNLIAGLVLQLNVSQNDRVYDVAFRLPPVNERETLQMITLVCQQDLDELYLGMNWSTENMRTEVIVYAPYWMINKTSLPLEYKEHIRGRSFWGTCKHRVSSCCRRCRQQQNVDRSRKTQGQRIVTHSANAADGNPLLFPLLGTDFFGKKKAVMRIANASKFSTEFPLDTPGTVGRVTSSSNDGTRDYEFTVEISLSSSGLTKIVTISPFFLLQNDSKFDLELREEGGQAWTRVPAEKVVGFWPVKCTKDRKNLVARFPGTAEESVPFPFGVQFEGFSKIDNDLIGIHVLSSLSESSQVIHVEPFFSGMAPAILMNATKHALTYGQKDGQMSTLNGGRMIVFAWQSLLKDRKLYWKCGDHEASNDLLADGSSTYLPNSIENFHHWISFLSGRQRYLLFTDDPQVEKCVRDYLENERFNTSLELNLHAIGISLVDNHAGYELLYMSLSDSGVSWNAIEKSFCTGEYTKPLMVELSEEIEENYQAWQSQGTSQANRANVVRIGAEYEVDFANSTLTKVTSRKRKPKPIHRVFQSGLYLLYKQSDHQTKIHLKVNHLQIDNQLPTRTFPCLLSVTPMPKSVIAKSTPKAFFELSLVMVQAEHSSVPQIKYLHALVQEFAVSADMVLINAILRLFSKESLSPLYTKEAFDKDIESVHTALNEYAIRTEQTHARTYYENLHISPLMIHLSFSQGVIDPKHVELTTLDMQWGFLNLLFKSVGLTLTEIQDCCFRLAYFERQTTFYTQEQLVAEVSSHYTTQVLKQVYKLVLGLDILGNPYGVIMDLAGGVQDLFYHPIQGLILGPDEFASGLYLGISSIYSAAVGGAFNVATRIGGTLGKGVAALTFDDEYQRQRMQHGAQRPADLAQGLTRGVQGMGQGLLEGVTGIIRQPIEGAQRGGVGGFAKGFGKGIIGVVARPVSSVVDAATGTLDSVKGAVGLGSGGAEQFRPPRIVIPGRAIRPYIFEDAMGKKLLEEVDSGKFDAEEFVVYGPITVNSVLLVTNRTVIFAKKSDLSGNWSSDWTLSYNEIKQPIRLDKGVKLEYKQAKRGFLGIGESRGKLVQFSSPVMAQRIVDGLIGAYDKHVS